MSSSNFHFEVKGDGIAPGTIPLRHLLLLLRYLNDALVETAKFRGLDGADAEYCLTDVSKGNSSDYEIHGSHAGLESVDHLTRAIADRSRFSALPPKTRESVRGMWVWAHDYGCDALAFTPNGSEITPAVIAVEEEIPDGRITYTGQTTLYGECLRAGGDRHRSATIRLPNGKTKAVRLATQALAEELGHRLYQTVGLVGQATWDAETRTLVLFRAETLAPFHDREPDAKARRTVVEALGSLAEAASGRWDEVDADEFVEELRRD